MSSEQPRKIFQQKALEHLSTPEQLDQLLQVVNRKSWIPIATLGGLLLVAILWSLLGHIPVTVEGLGLLVHPRQIASFQFPASGQVIALNVKVGDMVQKGQVLGAINQPALEQSLQQERVRLVELQERNSKVGSIRNERTDLEKEANARERRVLQDRIEVTRRGAENQKAKNDDYYERQRKSLDQLRQVKLSLGNNFKARYEGYQNLRSEGLVSNDAVLNVQQEYINNQAAVADLDLQIHQSELQQLQSDQTYQQQMETVANLQTQLAQLEVKAKEIDQQQLETQSDNNLQIQEVQRNIARYEEDLRTKSQIISEYTGRVIEVTGSVGQIVTEGQRLGSIETEDATGKLLSVAYFGVSDGKKIQPGMEVRITPATVERERYGSIVGKVVTVSPFPVTTEAVTNVVGNAEVAKTLSGAGNKIEIFAELALDSKTPSGYRWTSGKGPDVQITAGTTGGVRTTIEYRRPITFVIPILRGLTGV